MYLAQTKKKNGLMIVEGDKKFFVSWEDLQLLKEDRFLTKDKPIIVLNELPE